MREQDPLPEHRFPPGWEVREKTLAFTASDPYHGIPFLLGVQSTQQEDREHS
jgi:hypothetical protein